MNNTFFQSAGKVAALETLVAGFSPDRLGTLESEAARRSRVHEELGACAETLRRELGHPVRSLCWPWGSGSEVAREEGRKAGFSVFFTTRMGANPPAAPEAPDELQLDPDATRRFEDLKFGRDYEIR